MYGDALPAVLIVAVFLGAIVQGFSGFAFSAVAGAILLQVEAPGIAIPLLMICSLTIQLYVLMRLRASISFAGTFHCAAAAARSRSRALAPACIRVVINSPEAPAPANVDQMPVAPR